MKNRSESLLDYLHPAAPRLSKTTEKEIAISFVLHIPLAETIKELDNFILKGVDLYDHTKVFL